MKKLYFLVVFLFAVFVITGCEKNDETVLTCSGASPGNNMSASSNVEYTFKNDKLTKAKIDVEFKDITIDNLSSLWNTLKTQFTEQNQPVEEIGFKRTVSADDENYIFTVSMEIDYEKITKEIMDKYGIEDYTEKTYEELKDEATADGTMTCE